ncbi:hypothetical protein ACFY0N_00670 [Streptomyces vinaceus]|uniref:hypothetical protein n=1 Tax=Streptomyces vinaceus TaxID=1960 RepID=UPI0036BAE5DF
MTRTRQVTTEIDGFSSTREEPYEAWEAVRPREWDDIILRGVTGVIIGFASTAVVATAASVGGLLTSLMPTPVALLAGAGFSGAWMACVGFEWLERVDPKRGRAAQVAGWVFLLLSMGATFTYGHTLDKPWAGVGGACVDLIAKGLLALLMHFHRVPLDEDLALWVTKREQHMAGKTLLGKRILRLNRMAAYQRAVGAREYEAADALMSSVTMTRTVEEGPEQPGPAPLPAPAAPAAPIQIVPAQVVVPQQPAAPAPPVIPAPAAPQAPNHFVPPVPPVPPADDQTGGGAEPSQAPVPPVADINRPAIAAICRATIQSNPAVTDAELVALVLTYGHEDKPSLADTVRRSAQRIDPSRKATAATG